VNFSGNIHAKWKQPREKVEHYGKFVKNRPLRACSIGSGACIEGRQTLSRNAEHGEREWECTWVYLVLCCRRHREVSMKNCPLSGKIPCLKHKKRILYLVHGTIIKLVILI
jgi:hypothetical protein